MSNSYSNPGQRIGRIKGDTLKYAMAKTPLDQFGDVHKAPVNQGDTVVFRQMVPFGATVASPNTFSVTAAQYMVQEGVSPPPGTMSVIDTETTVRKYGATMLYTEKQKSLGEDPMPEWMAKGLGDLLGLVRHQVYVGGIQGCTNLFYSGGTTRLTVDEPVTRNLCDRIVRNMRGNHAEFMTEMLKPSGLYGTSAIQPAYVAVCHSDLQQDIERVSNYTALKDYGQLKPVHKDEIGCVGQIRFILSPEMPKFADAGAAIAGTTNYSTTGTSADVYQIFVMAESFWGRTSFRGLDALKIRHVSVDQVDKSDPSGERGYVSGTFYDAAVVTNNGWGCIAEVTMSALT